MYSGESSKLCGSLVGCEPFRLGYRLGWNTIQVGRPFRLEYQLIHGANATLYSLGAAGTRLSLGMPIGYLLLCLARHA